MKQPKNLKKKMKQPTPDQRTEFENQVMVLALNKLTTDWFCNRFTYSEGPEKYFEDWVEVNNVSFTPTFESSLFAYFVKFLIMRGNTSGK